ncbi:MAG: hypothetical protein ABH827_00545 [bacterium]
MKNIKRLSLLTLALALGINNLSQAKKPEPTSVIPEYTIDAFTKHEQNIPKMPEQILEETVDNVTGLPIYTIEAPLDSNRNEAPMNEASITEVQTEGKSKSLEIKTEKIPTIQKQKIARKERTSNVLRDVLIIGSITAAWITLFFAIKYRAQLANTGQAGYAAIANLVKQYGPKTTEFLGNKIGKLKKYWNNGRSSNNQPV